MAIGRPGKTQSSGRAAAAQKAATEWIKKYWPGLLKRLEGSEDERLLLDLGKLMLSYAYGRPREMVEHSGEVVHSYVVEAPVKSASAEEWAKAYSPDPGLIRTSNTVTVSIEPSH